MKQVFRFLSVAALLLLFSVPVHADPSCCEGRVGDVNGTGGDEPTISDITRLIDRLYINTDSPIPCPAEADINGSGFPDPTVENLSIGDITWLIDYLFVTGSARGLLPCPGQSGEPYGYLLSKSECLTEFDLGPGSFSSTGDCIKWQYNNGRLWITHHNAGLNCCPTADFDVSVDGYTISIAEIEQQGLCDCNCLFDIQFVFDNLEPGEYRVIIDEPYVPSEEPPLDIPIDLVNQPMGLFCLVRNFYPWGTGGMTGYIHDHSGCKSTGSVLASEESETCIVYSYEHSTGLLMFSHTDAVFNCCPSELLAEFNVEGNTITVTEDENLEYGGCACLCLYDVDYVMPNVPPGEYYLIVNERYSTPGPPLEFMMDLTHSVSNASFCVPRDGYPYPYE